VLLGVTDDPRHQARHPLTWAPAAGPLLAVGMPGSGCTTVLRRIATELTNRVEPADVYVIGRPEEWHDLPTAGRLAPIIDVEDGDRLARLVELLDGPDRGDTDRVVLIDGVRPALETCERVGGVALADRLLRSIGERRPGAAFAVTADRVGAMPGALLAVSRQVLVLHLPDPYDAAAFGIGPIARRAPIAGRAVEVATGLEAQIAQPAMGCAAPRPDESPPDPLAGLPARVTLPAANRRWDEGTALTLTVGLADRPRGLVSIALDAGAAVLVAGPDGSGRTATLACIGAAGLGAGATVLATGPERSALRDHPSTERSWCALAELDAAIHAHDHAASAPLLVLVDDADLVEDDVVALVSSARHASLAVAASTERLRHRFGHWTEPLRRGRWGIALRPARGDGELWCTTLPASPTTAWPPGRAYLLDHGRPRVIQVGQAVQP
jgi:S-DNA-T family DNA segregation ATPase FtsK/SpoIIIE